MAATDAAFHGADQLRGHSGDMIYDLKGDEGGPHSQSNGNSRSKIRSQEAQAPSEWEDLFSHILTCTSEVSLTV